jgi:hypothetical protein
MWMEEVVAHLQTSTGLYGVKSQKTLNFIVTIVAQIQQKVPDCAVLIILQQ